MSKKLMATISLVFVFAAAVVAFSAMPAAAAPASPGACNMLHVSSTGYTGMLKASNQGLDNMIDLIVASLESGCSP
jgi:Flp pilus assembly protein TadB